jgi:hypothetical protein
MANVAVANINEHITDLQDRKRTAVSAFRAQAESHAKLVADIDRQLADWAEVLDRYHAATEPEPKKPAAKKAAAATKEK